MLVSVLADELDIDKSSLRKWIIKHFGTKVLEKVRVSGIASDMLAIKPEYADVVRAARIRWRGIDKDPSGGRLSSDSLLDARDLLNAFVKFLQDRRQGFVAISEDVNEDLSSRLTADDIADEYSCMLSEFKHRVLRKFNRLCDTTVE